MPKAATRDRKILRVWERGELAFYALVAPWDTLLELVLVWYSNMAGKKGCDQRGSIGGK